MELVILLAQFKCGECGSLRVEITSDANTPREFGRKCLYCGFWEKIKPADIDI